MCKLYRPIVMRKALWFLYLAVALVFIQGTQLHVHFYDHDHDPVTSKTVHQEHVHFDDIFFEAEHVDEAGEVELYQQGLVKNKLTGSLIIALFVAVIVTLLPSLLIRLAWRTGRHNPLSFFLFGLRPPLRAPPLD